MSNVQYVSPLPPKQSCPVLMHHLLLLPLPIISVLSAYRPAPRLHRTSSDCHHPSNLFLLLFHLLLLPTINECRYFESNRDIPSTINTHSKCFHLPHHCSPQSSVILCYLGSLELLLTSSSPAHLSPTTQLQHNRQHAQQVQGRASI